LIVRILIRILRFVEDVGGSAGSVGFGGVCVS